MSENTDKSIDKMRQELEDRIKLEEDKQAKIKAELESIDIEKSVEQHKKTLADRVKDKIKAKKAPVEEVKPKSLWVDVTCAECGFVNTGSIPHYRMYIHVTTNPAYILCQKCYVKHMNR